MAEKKQALGISGYILKVPFGAPSTANHGRPLRYETAYFFGFCHIKFQAIKLMSEKKHVGIIDLGNIENIFIA